MPYPPNNTIFCHRRTYVPLLSVGPSVVLISLLARWGPQQASISPYMRSVHYDRRLVLLELLTITRFQQHAPIGMGYQETFFLGDFSRTNYPHFRTGGSEIEQLLKHLTKPAPINAIGERIPSVLPIANIPSLLVGIRDTAAKRYRPCRPRRARFRPIRYMPHGCLRTILDWAGAYYDISSGRAR